MLVPFDRELKRRKDHTTGLAGTHCQHVPTGLLFTCLGKVDDARGRLVLLYHDGVFLASDCLVDPLTWEIMRSAKVCGVKYPATKKGRYNRS